MTLTLSSSLSAVAANIQSSFLASGGTPPYVYSVLPGGAGGTINSSTGWYQAPQVASSSPNQTYDTVQVTDSLSAVAILPILVGTPLELFCDVVRVGMGLSIGRVMIYDQKWFSPTDYGLWITVGILKCKPFSNIREYATVSSIYSQTQFTNMRATLECDIVSRGPAARDLKEQFIMSLYTQYSEQQQEANSFHIAKIPPNEQFRNLTHIENGKHGTVDGTAIIYRFRINVNIIYAATLISPASYFSNFQDPTILINQ